MEERLVALLLTAQVLVAGGIFFLLPRYNRRGLLFGVYVGPDAALGERAREIEAQWYRTMAWVVGAAILLSLVAGVIAKRPEGSLIAVFGMLVGFCVAYIAAYRSAQPLGVPGAPPAVASLTPEDPSAILFPFVALMIGMAGGLFAVGYAASRYAELPDRIPIHFGFSGRPDAWTSRSFASVMLMPLGTIFLGISLAGVAWLTARAKRAVRKSDDPRVLEAQVRFRAATATFLSIISILVTIQFVLGSLSTVKVAAGEWDRLHWGFMIASGLLLVVAVVGSVYLMVRMGQGGARIEKGAASSPLTNGLADNARWKLGAFYYAPDDPSIFVEKRFGIGYTLNFGNRWAVLMLVAFLVGIAAFVALALSTGRS